MRRKLMGILPLLCLYLFALAVTGIIPARVWEFVWLAPILIIGTFFALMHLGGLIFPLIALITRGRSAARYEWWVWWGTK